VNVREGVRTTKDMRSSTGITSIQKEKEKAQQERDEKLRLLFLKFRRSETELDWNYPFDFCGSIYRLSSVEEVMAKIDP
jgi:hypothetical protein